MLARGFIPIPEVFFQRKKKKRWMFGYETNNLYVGALMCGFLTPAPVIALFFENKTFLGN